ncbi:MAG: protease modulator HflK [Gemmataceae bacterium]
MVRAAASGVVAAEAGQRLARTPADFDQALHALGHRWRAVAAGVIGLSLLAWLGSGLYAIRPDEVGVVRWFGRVGPADLEPGLHWRWPWPVEEVTRVRPGGEHGRDRLPDAARRSRPGARSWSSRPRRQALVREPDEAVLLTGDGNLLELQGSVRYTVADPRVYLFGVARPEAALRDAAESVLREVVAARRMGDLLTSDRGAFQREVRSRLEGRLSEVNLGLRLEGVSLHDLHPPREVVQAYHEVTRAMERRDREVNQARADRTRRLRDQEAKGLEVVRLAEADRYEKVRLAQARKAEFLLRERARARLSWRDELELFWQAVGELERGRPASEVREEYRRSRQERAARQAALTDFRAYWDSLSQALAGRPKVLVDTDKLPGRRSLWLAPFEPPAMPAALPRTRRNGAEEP